MASQILRLLVCSIFLRTAESYENEVLDAVKELPEWKYVMEIMEEMEGKLDSLSRMKHGSEFVFQVEHSGVPENVQAPNTVKYDNILANKRLGYNNETGKFTCRTNGLYFFGYSSLPTRGTKTDVSLMRNGTPTSRIHSNMASRNVQDIMKSIILYLHKGDRVWVEVTKGSVWCKGGSITFQGFHIPE